MAAKKKSTQSPIPDGHDNNNPNQNLWTRHGLDDVYYQRETHVNFLSLMIGLAAGALLTQFYAVVQQVQASRWQLILYFIASIFLLINNWAQTSWGTLILKWPISIPMIVPQFIGDFVMSIMCLLVTEPAGWMAAAGFVIIPTLYIQFYFMRTGSWNHFSPSRIKEIKSGLVVYFFWMLMAFAAAFHLYLVPTQSVEIFWGLVALLCSIISLIIQHKGMERERLQHKIP